MGKNKVMTNILTKSSIATKLWVWFLIVAAAPLVIIGLLTNYSSIEKIKTEVSKRLNSVAESKTELINNYFKWRLEDVKILAENLSIIEASEKFTRAFEKHGLKSSEYKVIDKEFRRFLTYYKEGKGYSDILFISKAGDVVFTLMHEPDFGTNLVTGPYKDSELANVFSNAYTLMETEVSDFKYYPPAAEPSSFIASPVRKEGRLIGVIALQIDTREMNKLAQDFTGLGASGEIVISAKINNGALVLTPLRNDPHAAFKRIIPMGSELSLPVQKAVQGQKGSGIFKDYRGEEVFAVWRYLPYLRWGVVVKIDTGEAYTPIYKLTIRFLAVGIISAFILLFISFFLSKSISKPIKRLHDGVEIIATGNLNHVVGLTTKDEIGQLSRSFDRMVVNLKNINADLTKEISEHKRVEEELKISHKTYLGIINSLTEAIYIQDENGVFLEVNKAAEKFYGYPKEYFIGKTPELISAPGKNDIPMIAEAVKKAFNGEPQSFEFWGLRKNGTIFPKSVNLTSGEYFGKKVVIATARDITERKRAEDALRESEENFRHSLDDSPLGVRIVTAEGETIYANRAILDIYGFSNLEELRTTPVEKRYTAESYIEYKKRYERRQQGEDSPSEYEVSVVRKNGEVRHLLVSRKEQLWNGKKQYQTLYRDITERKKAEEEKHRMEERSRKVVEDILRFIPEGILVFSRKMELLRQNQAFRELVSGYAKRLGFAEDELENLIIDKVKAGLRDNNIKEIRIARKHETGKQT